VKLAALGDVLRTTSILPALKRKYPGSEITWVTKSEAAPLLKGNSLIDRLLVIEENYQEFILNEHFSVGIALDADSISATILGLSTCDERFGFVADRLGRVQPVNEGAREWWWMGINDDLKRKNRKTYQQIIYEMCGLQGPTERPQLLIDDISASYGKQFLVTHALVGKKKVIGVNTGGGCRWQNKKWTFDSYVGFINLLRYWYPDVGIVLLGGPQEVEFNHRIMTAVGDHVVDSGCTNSLMEFSSLIDSLNVLLTSDSLAMHIGVALRKATIVLVGPTSPWELDVYDNGAIVHSNIECLCCYRPICDQKVTCMNTLSPEIILSHVERYL
jgi:heptosyltransferase-2